MRSPPRTRRRPRVPTRRFSLLELTSGLPDDSREADERAAEWRLRDLRARVKHARAVVVTTPGLATTLATDSQKAASFYARFGITETQLRHGVPLPPVGVDKGFLSKRGGEPQETERRGVGGVRGCSSMQRVGGQGRRTKRFPSRPARTKA